MKFKLHLSILLLCTVISFSVASDAARDVKVFGGRDVSVGEFPYLVYLIIDRGMAHSYACSGGILNKRYIITAAHCIGNTHTVIVGKIDVNGYSLSDQILVQRAIKHEKYDVKTNLNDIALLELATDVPEVPYKIQYLYVGLEMPPVGSDVTITGFGRILNDQPTSKAHTGVVTVVDDSQCPFNGYDPKSFFCVNSPTTYSCSGDSGTSVVVKPNDEWERWIIVGIDSYGKVGWCGSRDPITTNTKIANFVDWIKKNTPLAPIVTASIYGSEPWRNDVLTPAPFKILSRMNSASGTLLITASLAFALLVGGILLAM